MRNLGRDTCASGIVNAIKVLAPKDATAAAFDFTSISINILPITKVARRHCDVYRIFCFGNFLSKICIICNIRYPVTRNPFKFYFAESGNYLDKIF